MSAAPWVTATEIAARWERVTSYLVTARAEMLGLALQNPHVRPGIEGALEYSPAVVKLIERELRSRGFRLWSEPR